MKIVNLGLYVQDVLVGIRVFLHSGCFCNKNLAGMLAKSL